MPDLVRAPAAPPAVVGERLAWARDGALLGLLLPLAASLPWTPLVLLVDPSLGLFSAVMGLLGAALGYVSGGSLEKMRGQVPIWLLGILAATVGAFWGFCSAWILVGLGASSSYLILGTLVPGIVVGLIWLPYTMARVLRWPVWPVILAGLALAPAAANLAVQMLMLI